MKKVLVVEDNVETQFLLQRTLSPHYKITCAHDLQSAWTHIEESPWDFIILDRHLPDGDGISLCLKLRLGQQHSQPLILMLTALQDLEEKIEGLTGGADDYIGKPFEPRELLARMEALLRRKIMDQQSPLLLTLENLVINVETQAVKILKNFSEELTLDLTPIEYKILLTLVKNHGGDVEREHLIQNVWEKTNLSERNIDTHICHLRKKISPSKLVIKNRRNKGYFITKV